MGSRNELKEQRRLQILDAAAVVFARLGFHRARMDDIVREAGLSKGALYWYFKSKDEIIAALTERLFARDPDRLQAVREEDASARERILQFGRAELQVMERMRPLLPLVYEYYASAARAGRERALLRRHFEAFQGLFSDLLRQGIERDEFVEHDVSKMAHFISALFEGLVLLWVMQPDTQAPSEIMEEGLNRLFAGIARPEKA